MKFFTVLFFLLATVEASAQATVLVSDREQIFQDAERARIESMLQLYRQKTGNLVIVATDSMDTRNPAYAEGLFNSFIPDSTVKIYAFALLLSRKNQAINVVVNKRVVPYLRPDKEAQLMEILSAGIPAFREKKREEGATEICKKAMELLDSLPR